MELFQQELSSSVAESALTTLLQNVVLAFMTEYFCVCVITSKNQSLNLNLLTPSAIITVDIDFERNFQRGINAGCQAFIAQNQSIWPFLDAFIPNHDVSDQRFTGKKLIAVIDTLDAESTNRLCQHPAMKGNGQVSLN